MIITIALIAFAVVGVMAVIGARKLEWMSEVRHPPDDDGCRKDEGEP